MLVHALQNDTYRRFLRSRCYQQDDNVCLCLFKLLQITVFYEETILWLRFGYCRFRQKKITWLGLRKDHSLG